MRKVLESLIISFSVFTVIYALLDPLGGLEFILKLNINMKFLIYIILILFSIFIGVLIFLFRLNYKFMDSKKNITLEFGEDRSRVDYKDFIKDTKSQLLIIGFSLPTFVLEGNLNILKQLIDNNVKIKFLFINPISPSLDQRPISLYKVNPHIRESCLHSISTLLKFKENKLPSSHKRNFEIGLMNILPSIGLIASDNKILWNPYLSTHTGTTSPYLINNSDPFSKYLLNHFFELWQNHCIVLDDTLSIDNIIEFLSNDSKITISVNKEIQSKFEKILKNINYAK
jgi:hypothetical protein